MTTDAAKEKAAKPQMFRLLLDYFPRALEQVALCGVKGADKHGYKSFLNEDYPADSLMDAGCRHIIGLAKDGELNEEDGNLYHRAQIAWAALASLEKVLIEEESLTPKPGDVVYIESTTPCMYLSMEDYLKLVRGK